METKPLEFIWNDSEMGKIFNKENTLLLDNEDFIKDFNYENTILIENFDLLNCNNHVFPQLSNYLNNIKDSINIQNESKIYY